MQRVRSLTSDLLSVDRCPAYVLAGGKSTRFGSDKAVVEIEKEALLLRLVRLLARAGHQVRVVAEATDRYVSLGIESLVDTAVGIGPLGGIAAALEHRRQSAPGWLMVVQCDLLDWKPMWLDQLQGKCDSRLRPICFRGAGDGSGAQLQCLPSLWHTSILPSVRHAIENNRYALRAFFNAADCVEGGEDIQSLTFNNVAELRAAERAKQNRR